MRKLALFAAVMTLVTSVPATAGPAEDATKAVTTDEFAPDTWSGTGSVKTWLDGYAADSKKRGISGGRVDYGAPLQASSDGSSAYIVLPTT